MTFSGSGRTASPGVSLVICCHNSAARLPDTLQHMADLVADPAVEWEVLIVDNASTDRTAEVAEESCPTVLRRRLRIFREPDPGLSHARVRGVREARHEIISFIDDDNWICPDWITLVAEIFSRDPAIGATGGPAQPHFESPPPLWFEKLQNYYAAGSQHPATGDITNAPGTLLWGAGLTIRKAAIESLFKDGFHFLLSDRKGGMMSTGGDTELCFGLRAAGWRFWYDERLKLQHHIPASRLTWSYALRLMRGMGEAAPLFNVYLIAFGRHPFDRQPPCKRTWLFQFLISVRNLVKLVFIHPAATMTSKEGSGPTLDFMAVRGQLSTLLTIRRDYRSLIDQIRSAKWNRNVTPRTPHAVLP